MLHSLSESPELERKIADDIAVAEAVAVIAAVVAVGSEVEVVLAETAAVVVVVASGAQAPAEDEELQCLLG